jgi:hypothetical protein
MSILSYLFTILLPVIISSYYIKKCVACYNVHTLYKNIAFLLFDHFSKSHMKPNVIKINKIYNENFIFDLFNGRALLIEGSDVYV